MAEQQAVLSPGSSAVFEETLEALADLVITIDVNSRIVYASAAALALLGYPPEELIGRSLLTLIPERLQKRHAQGFARYVASGERRIPWEGVALPAQRKDGTEVSVEISFGEYDLGGQRFFTGVMRDVSSRRRSMEALAASAQVYRQLFERNVAGVYRVDPEGRVLDVNEAMANMLGYTRQELLDRPADSVYFDSGDRREWIRLLQEQGTLTNQFLRLKRKDGSEIWTLENAALVEDGNNGGVIVGTAIDITERKRLEEDLQRLAFHDPLTGLANRRLLEEHTVKALARAVREKSRVGMLYMDLVRFKRINDIFGHATGDRILTEVADRYRGRVRASDTVARVGGDEFAVLLVRVQSGEDARAAARVLRECLTNPFLVDGEMFHLDMRIGVALFPDHATDFEELLSCADLGMCEGSSEETAVVLNRSSLNPPRREDLLLEEQLRRALKEQEFTLHYQPICLLPEQTPHAFEALLRWRHPVRGILTASEFIAQAEHAGLAQQMDRWVLRAAARQARQWASMDRPEWVAVNLSPATIEDPLFLAYVERVLVEEGISGERLGFELTERAMMRDPDGAARVLRGLRDLGIRIVIDDFGRGHSALAYLVHFPADFLKVDRFFIDKIGTCSIHERLVEGILGLCRGLELPLIAEGVEKPEQIEWLAARGCRLVQGYQVGHPVPPEELD